MQTKPTELGTGRLSGRPEPEAAVATLIEESPKVLPAPLTASEIAELEKALIAELHRCFDPEIPVNIYELGLIYNINIQPAGTVHIKMTLTSPACPVAGSLPGEVKARLLKVKNVTAVTVDIVWEPPWDKNRMSEAAKLQLGIDD